MPRKRNQTWENGTYKKYLFFSESLQKNSKKEETEKLIEQIRIERERDRAAMKRQQDEKEQHEKNVLAKNQSSGIYLFWKKLIWTKVATYQQFWKNNIWTSSDNVDILALVKAKRFLFIDLQLSKIFP